MVANGQSTAFKGTTHVNGGATLMIGDSSHTSAAFGDSAGHTAQFNVDGTLTGYGTIYGNVHNNGIIRAGGTSGVNGGLTINGNLTLTDNSILKTAMTPTGVSGLVSTAIWWPPARWTSILRAGITATVYIQS
jgi:hypothetical protein